MFAMEETWVCFQAVTRFCGLPAVTVRWRKPYESETFVPQINTIRMPPLCVNSYCLYQNKLQDLSLFRLETDPEGR